MASPQSSYQDSFITPHKCQGKFVVDKSLPENIESDSVIHIDLIIQSGKVKQRTVKKCFEVKIV